jgi:hypothetical protein
MTTVTHNLRLYVPDFDQTPWDTEVNTNWNILDATVGMFTAIPNLVGVWKNATAYTFGQSVIDSVDSSIWECVQSHTSSALPMTFVNERTSFPARWTQTTQSAQSYAVQAANSATAAANSAAAAEDAAASAAGKLPLTGGTLTGFLTLNADPTAVLHAVTKQYVDARVGATGFLPTTGGTLTGPLLVSHGITYNNMTTLERRAMAFGWNGTAITAQVDGVGISPIASQSFLAGNYLPLSGGTLTGGLGVGGNLSTSGGLFINSTGAVFAGDANYSYIQLDNAGWKLRYTRSNGTLEYLNNASLQLFEIDPSGTGYFHGGVAATGAVVANGAMYGRGGTVYWGPSDRSKLITDNSTYTDVAFLDNYKFQLAWSTGTLYFRKFDNTATFALDAGGNLHTIGNLSTDAGVIAQGTQMQMAFGGSGSILQMFPNWYWDWSNTGGDLSWMTPTGMFWRFRVSDHLAFNNVGAVAGHGAYSDLSDERSKQDIEPLTYGLDAIMQINPIRFTRVANNKHDVGFSAQDVQRAIPEAVSTLGIELHDGSGGIDSDEPSLGVSMDPIVAALVNGMKELSARLTALENK